MRHDPSPGLRSLTGAGRPAGQRPLSVARVPGGATRTVTHRRTDLESNTKLSRIGPDCSYMGGSKERSRVHLIRGRMSLSEGQGRIQMRKRTLGILLVLTGLASLSLAAPA